ncbi:MAG: penicillin-binding transpeptidase domain-containing protein [Asticcacaulis sp.]
MADVVTSGTAAGAADLGLGPIKMAGKTGTAQALSAGSGRTAHGAVGDWNKRDHAWFVAFAPADAPKYAIAVVCEHGGFGSKGAAPKAREIMRVALLKDPDIQARINNSNIQVTAPPPIDDQGISSDPDTVPPPDTISSSPSASQT